MALEHLERKKNLIEKLRKLMNIELEIVFNDDEEGLECIITDIGEDYIEVLDSYEDIRRIINLDKNSIDEVKVSNGE